MSKNRVTKNNPGKQIEKTLSALSDFDKNLSKAMKNIDASLNISIRMPTPKPTKKKVKVKKK